MLCQLRRREAEPQQMKTHSLAGPPWPAGEDSLRHAWPGQPQRAPAAPLAHPALSRSRHARPQAARETQDRQEENQEVHPAPVRPLCQDQGEELLQVPEDMNFGVPLV